MIASASASPSRVRFVVLPVPLLLLVGIVLTQSVTVQGATGQGDPQFTGFHGQSYQIHGFPEHWFNIISSPTLNVNAKFLYIHSGTCGYNNTECWTHPGTYMSAFGISMIDPSSNATVRLSLDAGSHSTGLFAAINDSPLSIGDRLALGSLGVHRSAYDCITLHNQQFRIHIINSDMFFNIQVELDTQIVKAGRHLVDMRKHRVDLKQAYPNLHIHGFVGQTWRNIIYPEGRLYEGVVDDYVCSGRFKYNSVFHRL